jgi:DNA-binding transcriptional MocR family regulator
MLLLKIDRSDPKPLFVQVIEGIRALADAGTLAPGSALPSSRSLAKKLGVDRTTVCRAYEELQAQGYVDSRPGSYTRVRSRRKEVAWDPRRRSALDWRAACSAESAAILESRDFFIPERIASAAAKPAPVDFESLTPDPRLFPLAELGRSIRAVLDRPGAESLDYASHQGYVPLREYISRRMRLHGVSVSAEEILVTNGAQQGLDLVSRVLRPDGGTIAIESPTYSTVVPLFRFNGLKLRPVPMTPWGMNLEILEKTLARGRVGFVYTIPNFHNPTGVTTSHGHREKLLQLCLKRRVPLVEDGFEEDMKYFGKVALPIKSMDENGVVIYVGTFSKTLFPGMRLGWLAADRECIRRLTAVKRFADLGSSHFVQSVMDHFCRNGSYDLHLRRLHRTYRKRLAAALGSMDAHFPKTVTWTSPVGGYTLWVRMPGAMTKRGLAEHMARFGVRVAFGGLFFPEADRAAESEYFRLSMAKLDEDEIRDGIGRLGKALKAL